MGILIVFSFLAGLVTVLSPCILPVLPIVLSGSINGGHRRPIGIVVGFILSFTLFTLFLSTLVKATGLSADFLRSFSVVIIMLFGISLLLPNFQVLMEKLFTRLSSLVSTNSSRGTGFFSGLLLGISLGLIWTPCVGPIIASVITLAATSSVNGSSFLITLAYSAGTAIPMFAITYGGRALLLKVPWLLKNTTKIQKTFGIIMILVALGILFNLDRKFQTEFLDKFPQYGAGLTKLEDNSFVKNQLEKIAHPDSSDSINASEAPELITGGEWFNTKPLTMKELRGKVVLIDFWTYTCINCIRTLPYLKDWNAKYKDKGLVIIGVHTPEFEFEKNSTNVKKAIADFKIEYPVMQDNDYVTWNAYSNRYWPAHYLIDKNGKVRDEHFGEGAYDETEQKIQELLKETGATITTKIGNPDYQIQTLTPETYVGYNRLGDFASPEGAQQDKESNYTTPSKLQLNAFAFSGKWKMLGETSMPAKGATLTFHFKAKDVYLVLNMIEKTSQFKVFLDNKIITNQNQGADVHNGIVTVDENRLYNLVHMKEAEDHTLKLEFLDDNSSLFAFTFG